MVNSHRSSYGIDEGGLTIFHSAELDFQLCGGGPATDRFTGLLPPSPSTGEGRGEGDPQCLYLSIEAAVLLLTAFQATYPLSLDGRGPG